jgi:hypothetical protein
MLASAMMVSGCSLANSSAPSDTFCLIAKPITWSADDTDATQHQILIYDAKGHALCGW